MQEEISKERYKRTICHQIYGFTCLHVKYSK